MRLLIRLVTFIAALSSAPAFAEIGAVAGYSHPQLGDTSGAGGNFTAGGVLEFGIADTFMLHTELRYVNHSVSSGTYNLLALPVLAQLCFPFGLLKPHLQTGPDFELKLSGDGFKSTDFTWDFGGGLGLELIPLTTFFLDVRYSLGLANVVDLPSANVKSSTWEILAGVIFGL